MILSENDLWNILLPILDQAVAATPGVVVRRAYQPSTQSDGEVPRVVVHRLSSRLIGAQGKHQERRMDGDKMRIFEVESWRKEDSYQVNAVVNRAADDPGYTAKDVLEHLSGFLRSSAAISALAKHGIGILPANEVTETPYEDDQDSYRISVSARFALTYKQSIETEIPVATSVEWVLHRV